MFLFATFLLSSLKAQKGEVFSLYLIGDAGKYTDIQDNPALLMLQDKVMENENGAVVFLGDNIYNYGLEKGKQFEENKAKIGTQLSAIKEYKGQVYFVPGNHDWQSGKNNGLEVVRYQAAYVDSFLSVETQAANNYIGGFIPEECGTPGPDTVRLTDDLLLVAIDVQWFLHHYLGKRVAHDPEIHLKEAEEKFWTDLKAILEVAKKKDDQVVMVAHHPLFSIGPHGMKKGKHDIFNGIARYNTQELYGKGYRQFREKMVPMLESSGVELIYAAGHDHNLQYWKSESNNHYIVSGAGSKHREYYASAMESPWNTGAEIIYPTSERYPDSWEDKYVPDEEVPMGFFRIDFQANGKLEIWVLEVGQEPLKVYSE